MDLWHYSVNEIAEMEPRVWRPVLYDMKPRGAFWFSDDASGYGWWDWVAGENMHQSHDRFNYRWKYPVQLDPVARILKMPPEDVQEFHARYHTAPVTERGMTFPDWSKVETDYDGVLFTPYERSMTMLDSSLVWYDGIDCESGFVFDHSMIRLGEGIQFREDVSR